MADTRPAADSPVRHRLQVHFDVHQFSPTEEELAVLADDADSLAVQVGNFPQADLRALLEWGNRNNEYAVKLSLLLPGETLVASDHDGVLRTAFERCLASLEENVRAYKDRLGQVPERQKSEKHTHGELTVTVPVDGAALRAAVDAGDYAGFRRALADYEDGLRLRAGRWVERYPAVQARMGNGLDVADVVEDVFLVAFEGFDARPTEVPLGNWLEGLLDPVVKALQDHPDEELENINMARSAVDADGGTGR